jgi:hypothetical protein
MTPLNIWIGAMTKRQADSLDSIFAVLTKDGWILPDWLIELKLAIFTRDQV